MLTPFHTTNLLSIPTTTSCTTNARFILLPRYYYMLIRSVLQLVFTRGQLFCITTHNNLLPPVITRSPLRIHEDNPSTLGIAFC